MAKRLSNEEFLTRVSVKFPDYKVLTPYINKRTEIEVKCANPDHNPYKVYPVTFIKGKGCNECNPKGVRSSTAEEFNKFLSSNFPNYTLLSEYTTYKIKVKVSCGNTDHPDFWISPQSLKSGSGCIKCAGRCPEEAKKDFLRVLEDTGYTLIGEYISAGKNLEICCPQGHKYFVDSRSFRKGSRCLICNGNSPTTGKVNLEYKLHESGFTLKSDYISKRQKILIECQEGHTLKVYPSVIKTTNYSCRYCVNRFYGFDNTRPASLYLQILTRSESDKCFKYGITNRKPEDRMYEQELVSRYDHDLVYTLYHTDGELIEDLERRISEKFKKPFLTKKDLKNGYRETVTFEEGIEVLTMMKNFEEDYLEIEGDLINGYYSWGQWC